MHQTKIKKLNAILKKSVKQKEIVSKTGRNMNLQTTIRI